MPLNELDLPADGSGSAAPVARRVAAYLLDAIASSFVAALFVHNGDLPGLAGRLPGAWSVIPFVVNYVGGLVLGGQTLGMHLLGLRVVRTDRTVPVGIGRAVTRTVLLILLIPAVIFDRNNRGLHDRVTDTVVVRA